MKPAVSIITYAVILIFSIKCYAQETVQPYTARAYWLEEHNSQYQDILKKQGSGQKLNDAETDWLNEYNSYLQRYYERLSDEEKNKYQQFRVQWNEEFTGKPEDSDFIAEKSKGVVPAKKFLLNNGVYGFLYGLAADGIFNINDPGPALALPFFTSGISLLMPVINKPRYENISYSTVMLARHGKLVGTLHGAAISLAIFGDSPEPAEILTPMVIMSIGLGEAGFQLGKKKEWSEGRVATYRYYGIMGPALASATLIAFHAEHARPYGITIPLAAVAGYCVGDRVYKRYQFTRGDMLDVSTFTVLSAGFGLGLVPLSDNEEDILAPLATTLAGSIVSQAILKNKHLTVRQGWNVNYFAGAGVLLGLGTAILTQSETQNIYFIFPAICGSIGWLAGLSAQTKNGHPELGLFKQRRSYFSMDLSPENYFLNRQFTTRAAGHNPVQSPMFRVSMIF